MKLMMTKQKQKLKDFFREFLTYFTVDNDKISVFHPEKQINEVKKCAHYVTKCLKTLKLSKNSVAGPDGLPSYFLFSL